MKRWATYTSLLALLTCQADSLVTRTSLPAGTALRRNGYVRTPFQLRRARSFDHGFPSKYLQRRPLILHQSSVGMDSTTREDDSALPTDDVVFSEEQMKLQQKELTRMILNGLLLAITFGYAAYTILNIDNGMTRGWTQGEIAMRIPLDNWLNYESSLADRPIFTKTAINVIIYLLGDWLSQTLFSKKHFLDFDAARTLRNGFIGLCFGPLVHEYYQFSDYILPVEAGMFTRLQKILMDQTIYLTVKCSIYISAVGLLQGDDWGTVKTNVQTKLPNIVLTAWKFWPLVHLVTYGVIPARHRILWVNCVDLVWNAILATMSQKKDVTEEVLMVEASTGLNGTVPLLDAALGSDQLTVQLDLLKTTPIDAVVTVADDDARVSLNATMDEGVSSREESYRDERSLVSLNGSPKSNVTAGTL